MADTKENLQLGPDAFKHVATNTQAQEKIAAPSLTFSQDAIRRLKQNKFALISFWILVIIGIVALLSIWFSPADPNRQHLAYTHLPPKWGNLNIPFINGYRNGIDMYAKNGVPKGTYFFLGTDYLGRDMLSRVLVGTRVSLFIALLATFFDLTHRGLLRDHFWLERRHHRHDHAADHRNHFVRAELDRRHLDAAGLQARLDLHYSGHRHDRLGDHGPAGTG